MSYNTMDKGDKDRQTWLDTLAANKKALTINNNFNSSVANDKALNTVESTPPGTVSNADVPGANISSTGTDNTRSIADIGLYRPYVYGGIGFSPYNFTEKSIRDLRNVDNIFNLAAKRVQDGPENRGTDFIQYIIDEANDSGNLDHIFSSRDAFNKYMQDKYSMRGGIRGHDYKQAYAAAQGFR